MPRPETAVPLALGVLAQWAIAFTLTGFSLRTLVLAPCAVVLMAAAGFAVGGRPVAWSSTVFWIVAPAWLRFWRGDFRPTWRHDVLPVLYGAEHSTRLVAGLALLAALVAALRLPRRTGPALAATLVLVALVLLRPDHATFVFGWHRLGRSLDAIRELGWSVRVVEYFPLAGLLALAIRRNRALAPLLLWFVATVVLPFSRGHRLLEPNAVAVVPGLPAYALLAGCTALLIPRPLQARLGERAGALRARRPRPSQAQQ